MKHLKKCIEHTILRADTRLEDVRLLCEDVLEYGFYGACVPPYFVKQTKKHLKDQAKVITVVGFPMGYSAIPSKVEEIKKAFDEGADEIDAVVNIAAVKDGQWNHIKSELDSMSRAVSIKGKVMKLIVETGLLTQAELLQLLPIAIQNDIAFIKTSTGINGGGATPEVVAFLRANLPSQIKIKASGGIRTVAQLQALLEAGADRIGTSNSVAIAMALSQM